MRPILIFVCLLTSVCGYSQSPEENLNKAGIKLLSLKSPVANYVHAVRTGNLIYLSGKGPQQENGEYLKGRLGKDLSIDQGYQAARLTGTIQLAVLKQELGDLSKVKRIVKVNGYVNSDDGFYDQPKVMNGFSDLMVEIFGDKGKHARTALGVNALPFNMSVEVEMIVEVY
ncbi:MAG: RidA family protein [Chitinophagaceae bacterium]|nr:MAG: RidA family protein [Chitinophagaceae bacterium]